MQISHQAALPSQGVCICVRLRHDKVVCSSLLAEKSDILSPTFTREAFKLLLLSASRFQHGQHLQSQLVFVAMASVASGFVVFLLFLPLAADASNVWSQISPTGSPPQARGGHAAVWSDNESRMYVFGGARVEGVNGADGLGLK